VAAARLRRLEHIRRHENHQAVCPARSKS
jgi:hypothetical protein